MEIAKVLSTLAAYGTAKRMVVYTTLAVVVEIIANS
jgi:hypothetical protein